MARKKNEYDNLVTRTRNYYESQMAVSGIELSNIVRLVEFVHELSMKVPEDDAVLKNFDEVVNPFIEVVRKCRTDKLCTKCGKTLYKSDLPQYDFVCFNCDENF